MSEKRQTLKTESWWAKVHWWEVALLVAIVVFVGSEQKTPPSSFWIKPDRVGDRLSHQERYGEAAKVYEDPWRMGVAQYRDGQFEAAAKTFAQVPGANGAYNQGNAWLMHGQYEAAATSYDRALSFHPGWKEAQENKALALARKQKMDASGKDRDKEQTTQKDKPDEIVFDQKGEDKKGEPVEINEGEQSDEELRASWLRRVQTTPGDFLKAKFAYQESRAAQGEAKDVKGGGK